MEDGGLWKEVLEFRYGSWRNLDIDSSNNKYSFWGRDLGKMCKEGP